MINAHRSSWIGRTGPFPWRTLEVVSDLPLQLWRWAIQDCQPARRSGSPPPLSAEPRRSSVLWSISQRWCNRSRSFCWPSPPAERGTRIKLCLHQWSKSLHAPIQSHRSILHIDFNLTPTWFESKRTAFTLNKDLEIFKKTWLDCILWEQFSVLSCTLIDTTRPCNYYCSHY